MRAAAACILAVTPALATSAAPAALPAAPPIPATSFFQLPAASSAALSPGGHFLAIQEAGPKHQQVSVIDLRDNSRKVAARFGDADVGYFRWVNDERLLFTAGNRYAQRFSERYAPGLYAVNRDGSAYRQLAARTNSVLWSDTASRMLPWHTFMLDGVGAQDSDWVYVADVDYVGAGYGYTEKLLRLNTVTGDRQPVVSPPGTRRYLPDYQGIPRLGIAGANGNVAIHYLDPASGSWKVAASFPEFSSSSGSFQALDFAADGRLYAAARTSGDTTGLHLLDLASGTASSEPILTVPGHDLTAALVRGKDGLLGARVLADKMQMRWFDPALQAVQAAIDAKLPDTTNLVTLPLRRATDWVLVESYSDRQPPFYSAYNTSSQALLRAGASRPAIDPGRMGQQRVLRYTARDGLQIPALLTVPAGQQGKLPLVVLVHGGPHERGTRWEWNADNQFLASRGYAVLEPEFRGSTGYGDQHFRAGWQQWGKKMQDDIADGASWAVEQGIADGKRICIAGGGYGGYSALMGLVNDPQLFKCGIAWAAITDIQQLYDGHWRFDSDLSKDFQQYGMPTLIGDPATHAEQFQATSPLHQAARITQPLLLAYGDDDRRVLPVHGTRLRKALRAAGNQQVEWIEYEDEEHGWGKPATQIDFWTRVEKFLGRHIGPDQKTQF
ncbi:hypothetical protein ASC94_22240 [Massilia sp. Root418]|nr:hypothetical protein ASC94_22240 [Massilia sp. Root418]